MKLLCPSDRPILRTIGTIVAIIIICVFSNVIAYAQKGLSIGDKVPDVSLTNIINYPTTQAKLSDFKGKLIILDFWATWCAPCIGAFPKTDSLHQVFSKDVVFLPVTYQTKEEVEKLFATNKKLKSLRPAIVTSDQSLHALFPHNVLPHYVWIDQKGIVIAVTNSSAVNSDNITKMLQESQSSLLPEKKDSRIQYNNQYPLLLANVGMTADDIISSSLFTRFKEGLPGRYDLIANEQGDITRMTMINESIQTLFAVAWSDHTRYFHKNRIEALVTDPLKITNSYKDSNLARAWARTNAWCYEVIAPANASPRMKMRKDLAEFFPQYNVSVEKKKRKCLVLVRTSKEDKIRSTGQETDDSFGHVEVSMKNRPLKLFIGQLTLIFLQHSPFPIIDETNYTGMVDLVFKADMSDVQSIRSALLAYDLDLVEKEREIEVLVIRDAK